MDQLSSARAEVTKLIDKLATVKAHAHEAVEAQREKRNEAERRLIDAERKFAVTSDRVRLLEADIATAKAAEALAAARVSAADDEAENLRATEAQTKLNVSKAATELADLRGKLDETSRELVALRSSVPAQPLTEANDEDLASVAPSISGTFMPRPCCSVHQALWMKLAMFAGCDDWPIGEILDFLRKKHSNHKAQEWTTNQASPEEAMEQARAAIATAVLVAPSAPPEAQSVAPPPGLGFNLSAEILAGLLKTS
jgi:hypothetical protein